MKEFFLTLKVLPARNDGYQRAVFLLPSRSNVQRKFSAVVNNVHDVNKVYMRVKLPKNTK